MENIMTLSFPHRFTVNSTTLYIYIYIYIWRAKICLREWGRHFEQFLL